MGPRDQRRHARGRGPGHGVRPAVGADGSAAPGPRRASRARRSTRRGGATTSTSPASAWPWSAPAAARSRSCPRSSRSSSRSTSTSARPAGRSRRWTSPTRERTKRLFERFPVAPAPRPRGRSSPSWSSARPAMTSHRWLLGPSGRSAARQINKAIEDPELRRKVTPDRRDRLQADHAHRRVVSDADRAERRARRPTGSPR